MVPTLRGTQAALLESYAALQHHHCGGAAVYRELIRTYFMKKAAVIYY